MRRRTHHFTISTLTSEQCGSQEIGAQESKYRLTGFRKLLGDEKAKPEVLFGVLHACGFGRVCGPVLCVDSGQRLNLSFISEELSTNHTHTRNTHAHTHISAFPKIQRSMTFFTGCPRFQKLSREAKRASEEPS